MAFEAVSAAIYGCSGLTLTDEEQAFFADQKPFGFILFARNIDTPDQVRALTASMRAAAGRPDAPILIDQEGGRVQRLRPPHWRQARPARDFGDLYLRDAEAALDALRLNYRLIAQELVDLGIDVDCVPCLDVPVPGAHDIIGDRAFSTDPEIVSVCGRAACEGLMQGGVSPVIKHVPGHGRATADSHHDLPRVSVSLDKLMASDIVPFRRLRDMPYGMTAHIVFDAIDPDRPLTQSESGIAFIRDTLEFDGLLMTDDLSMKALGGGFDDRAASSLAAGCDLVLHCNGDMSEMRAVAEGTGALSADAQRRIRDVPSPAKPASEFDSAAALARLEDLFL
ncbi:beta-N-acetylhexosaminidase [Pacificispira sp.]|uniref:beta-N-acetylhexosaminidase n=1 Tax=Pacificispira sp. TaxID=2888761 RepID=UPI003BA855D9